MSRSSNFLVSALQNMQALRKILQAFLRGGWKAAALEAVKHYWPYILGAAVGLILLPTIIMASLPSVMQSKAPETVTDEDITDMYISRMDEILCDSEVGSANEIRGCRSAAYIQRVICSKPCADRQQYRNDYKRFSAWVA